MLTIGYISCRKENLFKWFADSLNIQLYGMPIQLVVVDYWLDEERSAYYKSLFSTIQVDCVKPLPTYIQGDNMITSKPYFSASAARNAVYVHAIHGQVAFVDDLSVLSDNWLFQVQSCLNDNNVVTLGAYQKHRNMVVRDGKIISSEVESTDSRFQFAPQGGKITGFASWFYGCSFVHSLELALRVNGFDHIADISGYEDCIQGIRLEKAGATFIYNTNMLTIESHEHHFTEGNVFARADDEIHEQEYGRLLFDYGIKHSQYPKGTRRDQSHALLDITMQSPKYTAHVNKFNLRELRAKRERGEEITIEDMQHGDVHWFNKKPYSEY